MHSKGYTVETGGVGNAGQLEASWLAPLTIIIISLMLNGVEMIDDHQASLCLSALESYG